MNKAMKMMTVLGAVLCAGVCMARPHGGPHGGPGRGHGPVMRVGGFGHRPPPVHHHHHSHSVWGRGGRNFWPGFVGGVVGGLVYDTFTPSPVVVTTPTVVTTPVVTTPVVTTPIVTTPVYTTQSVWVEGRYVDQVQANGTVIRVWQPGHYEQRQVVVQ